MPANAEYPFSKRHTSWNGEDERLYPKKQPDTLIKAVDKIAGLLLRNEAVP